eukprot:405342-Prymnesium_polylepis.1
MRRRWDTPRFAGASGAHRGTLSGRRGGKRKGVAMPLTALRELTLPTQKAPEPEFTTRPLA